MTELGKLTPKQAIFVREYLLDLNATQAALRAGYSSRTARSQGQRLLTNVDIKSAIERALSSRMERLKIGADWVLSRLVAEANADIADIFDEDGRIMPVNEWPEIWRTGLVTFFQTRHTAEKDNTRPSGGKAVCAVRFSDRVKRLQLIGRHTDVQAFTDRVEAKAGVDLAELLES